MPAKDTATLTAEVTSVVTGQTTPESITPVTLGGLGQDLVDSFWNKTDDVNVSQFTNDADYISDGDVAGGDLDGMFPNPSVKKILGNTIPADANGTLTNDGAGNLSWESNAPSNSQSNVVSPAAMTGAALLMMGLAVPVTPNRTGQLMVVISGEYTSDDAVGNTNFQLRTGTGAAPSNGDGTAGTLQQSNSRISPDAVKRNSFSFNKLITGLTVGTPYWIDLAIKNVANGAVQLFGVSVSVIEQ